MGAERVVVYVSLHSESSVGAADASVVLPVLPVVRSSHEPAARMARRLQSRTVSGSPYLLRKLGIEWWNLPCGGAVKVH